LINLGFRPTDSYELHKAYASRDLNSYTF
jgi:hypothetical protein